MDFKVFLLWVTKNMAKDESLLQMTNSLIYQSMFVIIYKGNCDH